MSDEWYVRLDGNVRGPVSASQLRKALASGKIQPDTQVREGQAGEWILLRQFPEFGLLSPTEATPSEDSTVIESAALTPAGESPSIYKRLVLGGIISVMALGTGVFAGIQWLRPGDVPPSNPAAVASATIMPPSDSGEIKTPSMGSPDHVSVAAAATVVKAAHVAKVATIVVPVPPAKVLESARENAKKPAEKSAARSVAKIVRPAPLTAQVAFADTTSSQASSTRDSFDIPWPTPQDAADELDWEKLDTTLREHNKLFDQWNRQRHRYHELTIHLMQVANQLQDLERRAGGIGQTMSQIQGVLGDENTENAAVFAPPETPRYVQSLAKNYTLRKRDLSRLGTKAMHAMNDFNGTLAHLDTNLTNQRNTLTRATELRGEWIRITRPYSLWTRQERHIPVETSTRWILDNPVFAPAYVVRSITEIREKSFEKASQDIELALRRDPNWAELYALQGFLQDRAGKHTDADKSFKTADRLTKKTPSSFIEVCEGIVASHRRNYERARARFRSAVKHSPMEPAGQAQLALLLIASPRSKTPDHTSAVDAATAACKATSWSHWWCLDILGIAYAAAGDFDRAIGCVQRAKQAGPPDVQSLLDERIASYKKRQVPPASVGEL